MIFDYLHVAQRAKDINENCVAGLALFNVSREYEKLGALEASLKIVQDALELMKNDFGNLHYFMTLAHRAHLYFQLGRHVEAEVDYQMLAASEFREIQEIRKVLEYYRNQELIVSVSENELPFLWREKFREVTALHSKQERLTPLENRVVLSFAEGPKSKEELILIAYPDELHLNGIDDRLKQVLSRLRKKRPGLIIFEDQKYRLAAGQFL